MRIIGGVLRGRRLSAPSGCRVRPTADRTREAMFNVLLHGPACADLTLSGAAVVDAFAGAGTLGLEALSRGAGRAFFLETDAAALGFLRRNIESLDQAARAVIVNRDATRAGTAPASCDLALLDPPYGSDLAAPALRSLAQNGWLAAGAIAVIEHAAGTPFVPPEGFQTCDERRYGGAGLTFLSLSRR